MNAKQAILGFLEIQPDYGYELKKKYDAFFGREKPILAGQVYSTLSRLKRDGQVEEIATEEESGGPERIKYRITENGEDFLENWLATPEEPSQYLQANLYMKTVIALLREDNPANYLDLQRHKHIEKMRELTKERQKSSLADILLIDHAIFHIEADLRWIEMASSRLEKLRREIFQIGEEL